MKSITRETIIDRRQPRMSWGAVFAGFAISVGLWVLLQTLGMGVGLAAIDTNDAGSLRGVGIGTGVWSLIAPLLAMFIGGIFAGRLSGTYEGKVGGVHGAVMWALTSVLGVFAVISLVMALASSAVKVGGAAATAAGGVAAGAAGKIDAGGAMSALGIDANDVIAPINQRLQQEGKPPVKAEEITATLRAVAKRGAQGGKLDRAALVEELARNTSLTPQDAEQVADELGRAYQRMESKVEGQVRKTAKQAEHVALQAADKTGKALLWGGLTLLAALLASIGGGVLGARGNDPDRRIRRTTTTTEVPPPPPVTRSERIEES